MKSETGKKSFDVMKWLRETRDRHYEETKDMTPEERLREESSAFPRRTAGSGSDGSCSGSARRGVTPRRGEEGPESGTVRKGGRLT